MIDIHSHILNNIDDGSKSIEESIEILKELSNKGVNDIILTPHYIVDSIYQNSIEIKKKLFDNLVLETKKNNININLYLGNEIFIDRDIINHIGKDALTLNNTNYILLELPMSGEYEGAYDIIFDLIEAGYKVILAHPERYISVQKDISILDEYKELGVMFQSNIGSLYGMYGKGAKKTIKKLLKGNYIDFLATDVHNKHYNMTYFDKLCKILSKVIEKNKINDILVNTASNGLIK